MKSESYELISARNKTVSMQAIGGHFVTQHSHVSHCIDLTKLKSETTSAKGAAKLLAARFLTAPADTVITLERTKMVRAFLAEELAFSGINVGKNFAVVTPEITDDKMFLRDNLIPYVKHRRVILLSATATTGITLKSALEGIVYYGGEPVGAAVLFGGNFGETVQIGKFTVPVERLFSAEDVDGYASYPANACPLCRAGKKVDAVVNSYGYSKL